MVFVSECRGLSLLPCSGWRGSVFAGLASLLWSLSSVGFCPSDACELVRHASVAVTSVGVGLPWLGG